MRRALDGNPYISLGFAEPGWGYFGKHAGYDYSVKEWPVKAPEAGKIIRTKIAPNDDGGNIVELQSASWDHRFLHLKDIAVKVGDYVQEGQVLGTSGNTGNVEYHLHHDVRLAGTAWTDSFSNYVDWEGIIKRGSNMEEIANLRLKALNDVRYGVGIPAKESNTAEDIIARTQLVPGDVKNLWLDTFGRPPTPEETRMIEEGPKEFLYFFQQVVKKELSKPKGFKPYTGETLYVEDNQ